ncbi:MAG: (d)CMP kinase [Clostridiales bacterium]|nr:(d)CMP kinase [Clostridiales bacterium]
MTAKQIAIDGPAGAGKSTVAKLVAARLQYLYIDTGAMYRAVALAALRAGVAVNDAPALGELAQKIHIELVNEAGNCRVYCDGEDISEAIRSEEVGNAASPVSAVPAVREALVAQQQRIGAKGRVVMDGRDIGTKVLPQAECKIFLTASLAERARRRTLELKEKGQEQDETAVMQDIAVRDERDSNRAHSPLAQAEDAVLLDSSGMTIVQVVDSILEIAGR